MTLVAVVAAVLLALCALGLYLKRKDVSTWLDRCAGDIR